MVISKPELTCTTRENLYLIKTLKEFQYVDDHGKDVGANGEHLLCALAHWHAETVLPSAAKGKRHHELATRRQQDETSKKDEVQHARSNVGQTFVA